MVSATCKKVLVGFVFFLALNSGLLASDLFKKEEYRHYRLLTKALSQNRLNTAQKWLGIIESRQTDYFLTKKSKLAFARYYLKRRDTKRAREWVMTVISGDVDSLLEAEALVLLVTISMAERNLQETVMYYGRLVSLYPEKDDNEALLKIINLEFNQRLTVRDTFMGLRDHYVYLKNLFRNQYYEKVVLEAEYIRVYYDQTPLFANIYFLEGLSYFYLHSYLKAAQSFKKSAQFEKDFDQKYRNKLFQAKALYRANQDLKAIGILTELTKRRYRTMHGQDQAFYTLLKLYEKNNKVYQLGKLEQVFSRLYPQSFYYQQLVWESDWKAGKGFDKIPRRLGYRMNAFYISKFGSIQEGRKLLPLRYPLYKRVKEMILSTDSSDIMDRVKALPRRSRQLAFEELSYRTHKTKGNTIDYAYAQSFLLMRKGQYSTAINFLDYSVSKAEEKGEDISGDIYRFLYPRLHWSKVKPVAREYGLDPYFVLAIMRQESLFQPEVSKKNRYGLLKVDSTISAIAANREGEYWKGEKGLVDVERNLRHGCFYLRYLNRLFKGDLYKVLIAYHTNINTAQRLKSSQIESYEDAMRVMGSFAYKSYVTSVMDNYLIYSILYGSTSK